MLRLLSGEIGNTSTGKTCICIKYKWLPEKKMPKSFEGCQFDILVLADGKMVTKISKSLQKKAKEQKSSFPDSLVLEFLGLQQ